ncbi:unnamed protein product [Darwinula stevensoni]|uniref:VPS8-like TPR-like repeats domain-containing protein n=1 Tax=Darwinula stevensoni TaxID=69355 RepID=A0A7R8XEX0_9CRUS|nr:unnamed protein product [Darwinula stevensoni]CAG0891046.1 unnamed protein product [Darwinula stevensoni]
MISSMLGYVPMPAVVKRIISDPAYCSRQFGELRELINGVLEAYNYEEVLLSCTLNLLHLETHKSHIEYVGDQNKGHPSGLQLLCSSCAQPLKGNFIFFRCGHKYHRECCKKDRMDWVCKFCFFKGSPNASEFSPVRHEGRGPSPLLDESGPNDQKYEEFLNALRQRRRLDSDSQMVLVSLMDCCSTSTSGSTQSDPDAVGSSWAPHLQVAAPRPFRFKSEF